MFQSNHIKKSKAHTAKDSVLKFNPNVEIVSHFDSIFDLKFDLNWFKSFDIIVNALDNLAARQHVNIMAAAANIPLVESGTAGYVGQVSVHKKGIYKCFDCDPKPIPKTFPVCTIRSTPSTLIHCIVWAKSFLFGMLFGIEDQQDQNAMTENDADQTELENLKNESIALTRLKSNAGKPEYTSMVFNKVFNIDVQRLLSMDELWKSRTRPIPMKFHEPKVDSLNSIDHDQTEWSLEYTIKIFKQSLESLSKIYQKECESDPNFTLSFDKDDQTSLDFVTSSSNLRARIFNISPSTRFKIKEMAGNIIPAIATTNAIIAGMIVLSAIKILDSRINECRNTYLMYTAPSRNSILSYEKLLPPNPDCGVCSNSYLIATCDFTTTSISNLVDAVLKFVAVEGEVSVEENGRLLYDYDFLDNSDKMLGDIGLGHGKRVMFNIEGDTETYVFILSLCTGIGCFISGELNFVSRKRKVEEEEVIVEKRVKADDLVIEVNDDGVMVID